MILVLTGHFLWGYASRQFLVVISNKTIDHNLPMPYRLDVHIMNSLP